MTEMTCRSRLKLIHRVEARRYKSGNSAPYGLYQCECGNTKVMCVNSVNRKRSVTCGECKIRVRKRRTAPSKGKFRLYQTTNKIIGAQMKGGSNPNYTRHIYIDDYQYESICNGYVPPEIQSKCSICERTRSIIIH